MQRVRGIVGDQMVGLPIQGELGTADTIGVTAGDRAGMRAERLIFVQGLQAEDDVVQPSRDAAWSCSSRLLG